MQKEYTHTVDGLINGGGGGGGLYPGGLISGIIYIRWKMDGHIKIIQGLKTGGLVGILRYVTGVNTTNIFA